MDIWKKSTWGDYGSTVRFTTHIPVNANGSVWQGNLAEKSEMTMEQAMARVLVAPQELYIKKSSTLAAGIISRLYTKVDLT